MLILKFNQISEVLREITYVGIMLLPGRNSLVLKDDFPIPLNCIAVQRQTKTTTCVLHDAAIDDYWNTDGDTSLSEPFIGVTRFELLNRNPPAGPMWAQGSLTKKQVTTIPGHMRPGEWLSMSKSCQRKAMNRWAEEKTNLDAARAMRHLLCSGR